MNTLNAKLNKRERRAKQLLEHYQVCERLALYLAPCRKHAHPDGKRISVQLLKAERLATSRAERMCSDSSYMDEDVDKIRVFAMVRRALGVLPPGFFVNGDPRGAALKIDNENPEGRALIETVGLHTDLGGFGILSPEINGDR